MSEWTLFSNHGHVLVCLANNNEARLRDVAAEVGITERAVQNILRELQQSGIVQVSKHGRCNHYQINTRKSLRHPLEAHCSVGKLLALLKSGDSEAEIPEPVAHNKPVEKAAPPPKAQVKAPVGAAVIKPPLQEPSQIESSGKPADKVKSQQPEPENVVVQKAVEDRSKPVQATSKEPINDEPEARQNDKKAGDDGVKRARKKDGEKDEKQDGPSATDQGSLF